MRQLVVITALLLLPVPFAGNVLFAQENGRIVPVTTINTADNIDVPYKGKWGWHKVHMRPLKRFLIGSPLTSSRKIDVCFRCHQKNDYRICDPHTQLNKKGDIITEKCLYCHLEKPDEKVATFQIYRSEIKFSRKLEDLCLGCHSNKQYVLAHPLNANHLLKPSAKMLSMMKKTEKQFGILFPLAFDGKIMCATCHNPHERGVIPDEREASGGAGEKDRIRLPGQVESDATEAASKEYMTRMTSYANKICLACHQDKDLLNK
jgi:hypothetical protein